MYKLEMKRLLKTRSTCILMAVALLVTLIFWCINVFDAYYYSNDGKSYHGLDAMEMRRIIAESAEGEWTPERLRDVFTQVAEENANYGAAADGTANDNYEAVTGSGNNTPSSTADYTLTFMRSLLQVCDVQYVNEITPEMAAQYYTLRKARIEEATTLNYGPAAAEAAL